MIALVPVATNTSHWKDHVWPAAAGVCFVAEPRFKFLLEGNPDNKGAPVAVAVIYWGHRYEAFKAEFEPRWGKVLRIS